MNKLGEIIIVDDDIDDLDILEEVYSTLPFENKLVLFHDGDEAYTYLTCTGLFDFLQPEYCSGANNLFSKTNRYGNTLSQKRKYLGVYYGWTI